jgi:hypothetical protein
MSAARSITAGEVSRLLTGVAHRIEARDFTIRAVHEDGNYGAGASEVEILHGDAGVVCRIDTDGLRARRLHEKIERAMQSRLQHSND